MRIEGSIDRIERASICGWAFDPASPEVPLVLEISLDGVPVGKTVADRYRDDLERAGLAAGRCAFAFAFPTPLACGGRHVVCLSDQRGLACPGSPWMFDRAQSLDVALALVGEITQLEPAGMLRFLADQTGRMLQARADVAARRS